MGPGGREEDRRLPELLAYYQYLNSEITRYRNREWLNAQIFTGAIIALYGLVVSNHDWWVSRPYQSLFILCAFVALAGGNIFFSCHARTTLAYDRTVLARLVRRDLKTVLEYYPKEQGNSDRKIPSDRFSENYWRGFRSHLVPFWMASGIAMWAGIWALPHRSYPIPIASFLIPVWLATLFVVVAFGAIILYALRQEYRRLNDRANRLPSEK